MRLVYLGTTPKASIHHGPCRLREAGYPDGLAVALIAPPHLEVQATVVGEVLEQVGFQVKRQMLDPAVYNRKTLLSHLDQPAEQQAWDIALTSWNDSANLPYMQCYAESCWVERKGVGYHMIDLKYALVIEATADPSFFGFYSPDLEGFTGVGHSIEDCLYKAKWGMEEHVALLREQGLPVPEVNPNPTIVIQNEERAEAVA